MDNTTSIIKTYITLSTSESEYRVYAKILGYDELFSKINSKRNEILSGTIIDDTWICKQLSHLFEVLSKIPGVGTRLTIDRSPLFDLMVDDGSFLIIIFFRNNKINFSITKKSTSRLFRQERIFASIRPVLYE